MKTFKKGFRDTKMAFGGWILAFGFSALLGAHGVTYLIGETCVGIAIVALTFYVGYRK